MNDKARVALHAANMVDSGMCVGLGTGSTADCFIEALARRHREDGLDVTTVASSVVSSIKAQQLGLPLIALEHVERLDLYVDGADEVAPDMTLLKGRGYDLVREKLLANAAERFIVLIDRSKQVERIGKRFPIPVEVMPFAWRMVKHRLERLGGKPVLRKTANNDGLVITSYGSLVLDTSFEPTLTIDSLVERLDALPGVVEHGIFRRLASSVLIGAEGAVSVMTGDANAMFDDWNEQELFDDGTADGD
ncbi:MAG: ribose-5-phosphate isomerase RpiA [Methylomicrobium sp.]